MNRTLRGLRVLVVVPQLDVGGAETQACRLAIELNSRGHEAEIATFYDGGSLRRELEAEDVPVHTLRRSSVHGLETISDLIRLLSAGDYDVCHSFLWSANWRARLAARVARIPAMIASIRSVDTWMTPVHVLAEQTLIGWTDALIVNAEAIRSHLTERARLPPERIRVVPNGVRDDLFGCDTSADRARRSLGLPAGCPVVSIVGSFEPEKNQEDFLRMAAGVLRSGIDSTFAIIGTGRREAELRAIAEQLGLNERVVWAGFRDDVSTWLAASTVVLNVSRREGCCNAILEAMTVGRPVVAYEVGGNPELVLDGLTGRLVRFGDVGGLTRAVEEYLKNRQLADAHGQRARQVVVQKFSMKAMVDATFSIYMEHVAEP